MKIPFKKYQGTGNDFVIIDQRETKYLKLNRDEKLVAQICDRRFGVGADGLMLLENCEGYDFKMVYFNADGNQSTMCGNGGRCLVHFAMSVGIIKDEYSFIAIDGPHQAKITDHNWVELQMIDVDTFQKNGNDYVLDTGSPHYVQKVTDFENFDVYKSGYAIRNSETFKKEGINVNFIQFQNEVLNVATYERGVEDETLSCGTGVTASVMSYALEHLEDGEVAINVDTKGGKLKVLCDKNDGKFTNVWLCGPATPVFEGTIEL